MKTKMFEELLGSVREAGAILHGQQKPSRRFELQSSGIRQFANEPASRNRSLRISWVSA